MGTDHVELDAEAYAQWHAVGNEAAAVAVLMPLSTGTELSKSGTSASMRRPNTARGQLTGAEEYD